MSSGSIRIIQLPEKSSVNTDDYMAVDSSANGTKKVKFTDLLDDNLSAQNKAADAQATGEAINELNTNINNTNTRIDNLIIDGEPSIKTLWTGQITLVNRTATLSESVNNFDYLDFYTTGVYRRVPVSAGSVWIDETNISDDGSSNFQQTGEQLLTFSGTTVTLSKAHVWEYVVGNTPTITEEILSFVTRIDGVKNNSVALSEEVSDIRVGDDGVTYQTAGEAVRTQFADVKADLNATMNNDLHNLLDGVAFVKGSINGGEESTSNTRIRSEYIDVSNVKYLHFKITSGYKYGIYYYTAVGTWAAYTIGTLYTGNFSWRTDELILPIIPTIKYIRVLVADSSDSSSITPTDKSKLSIMADYALYSLQKSGEQAQESFYKWLNGESCAINPTMWGRGVPEAGASANGITTSTTRIWSGVLKIPTSNGRILLSVESGYKVAYYIYDKDFQKVTQNYWETSYDIQVQDSYKYLIVGVATTNDDTILPSASSNVSIKFMYSDHMQHIENITNNSAIDLGWELGTLKLGEGTELASTTRIRSNFILVGKGTELILNDSNYRHLYYKYDLSKAYKSDVDFTSKKLSVNEDCYIRILICKDGNGTITSGEVSTISAKEEIFRAFPQVMVGEDTDNTKDIPSYFVSEISSAISTVKSNAFDVGIDGDSFVFITDVHWQSNSKHSPALIKQVIDSINVGKIVCGGDLIGGGGKSAMIDLMSDCINSFKNISRLYVLLGNHDTNKLGADSPSDYFSKGEAYALMQKESDFIMDYGNLCYFFFDNATTKTRYICLDTGEEGTTLDATQSAWLSDTLSAMPSGYHALIFAHIIYQTSTTWHIGLDPSELEMTSFMDDVCEILDTFNSNNDDKKVEAVFGGHVHIDADFTTTGGIPIVLTDCDTRQTFTETSSGSGVANHAVGTVNEQCFDITTIDYTNKTIKCVRVGRGSDRTITY